MQLPKPFFILFVIPLLFAYFEFITGDYFYFFPLVVTLLGLLLLFFRTPLASFSPLALVNNTSKKSKGVAVGNARVSFKHALLFRILSYVSLFLILTFIFSYISLYYLPSSSHAYVIAAFFLSYFELAKKYFLHSLGLALLSFILIFFINWFFSIRRVYIKSIIGSLALSLTLIFASILVSYFVLYGIGLGKYAFAARDLSDKKLGSRFVIETDAVTNKVREMKAPPKVVLSDNSLAPDVVRYLVNHNEDPKKFYAAQILTHLPSSLKYPTHPINSSLVLLDSTLFIQSLEQKDVEKLSPALGKLLVKSYFKDRFIKEEPKITVLGRQEYLKYREDQINEQVKKIQELIDQVQKNIASVNSNISAARNKVTTNQSIVTKAQQLLASDYQICTTEMGYDVDGNYVRYYSDSYCAQVKAYYESIISAAQKALADAQRQLQSYQMQLAQYTEAKTSLETIRSYVNSQKDATPQELGIFLPENDVKLALDSTDKKNINTYAVTLAHEYLHYTSYVSKERTLPRFFEEGLTEYYARKIISSQLGSETNVGYPLIVKIISQLAQKLPEKELEEIYFTKDTDALVRLLDRVYGKDFYVDSEFYFTAMSYVSSRDALKFANNIMFKIGGAELTEKDLYSDIH